MAQNLTLRGLKMKSSTFDWTSELIDGKGRLEANAVLHGEHSLKL